MEVTLTSPPTPLERAQAFLELLRGGQNYDEPVLDGLTLERAWDGGIVCRLQAARKHANRYGTMHGGCIGGLPTAVIQQLCSRCEVAGAVTSRLACGKGSSRNRPGSKPAQLMAASPLP
jgi:acyl-coenzyme A thioesterase PaaI-like protein